MSELGLETLLEATLFGSGKSLSIKDLSESLGYEGEEIQEALASLQGTLKRRRGGALRIVEIGGKWAMEVRPNVAEHLPKETKTEMPKKLLKAAALIAYHQPMPQSRLVELLGQKAYDYVRELSQYGMIMRRRDGNTRRLTTTRRFSEAFGCPHTDLRKVRKWFREQVNEAGLFDGMDSEALKEVGEDGLIQATLPLEEE
ncbi:MAG: SMC-Scp complex subunit ScpB [Candidatus Poseidoniaceae archaeon]